MAACISSAQGPATDTPAAKSPRGNPMPTVGELPVRTAMPDPLVTDDGQKIATADQWKQRRGAMKRIIEYYAPGHAPPPPGNVTGHELLSMKVMDGKVTCRFVRLTFGPGEKLGFDLNVFVPAETDANKAPFPTIVQPAFSAVHAADHAFGSWEITAQAYAEAASPRLCDRCLRLSAVRSRQGPGLPAVGLLSGLSRRPLGRFGGLGLGDVALVDYLQTRPFADWAKIIAVGHPRLGKTALVAGAFDERFALTAPAGSGCGGTGAYRFNGKGRGGKEGLEDATKHFPQWFGPRLAEFSGQVEKLPFDQHWLIALVAPRLCIAADGLSDPYANGNALAQSYLAAKPVYALLGVPDHLGINFRPGGHKLAPEDWQAILDFSDQQLRHRDVKRRSIKLPPGEQLR